MKKSSLRTPLSTWLAWAFVVSAPFLVFGILSLATGKNVVATYPVWSDELDYWRNLFSFSHVGFQKGYSGMFEANPAIGTLSVHGLSPIFLYMPFVWVFGLTFSTIMLANATWCSLGALLFCWLRKPKAITAWLMGLFLLTYAPLLLYAPTSMTEMANYGLLLIYLTFLLGYLEKQTTGKLLATILAVCVLCLYRIPYFLLFFPIIWTFGKGRISWRMFGMALLCGALTLGVYALSSFTTAPYAMGFLYHWVRADSFIGAIQMLLGHTKSNLISYFDYYLFGFDSMEGLFRLFYLCAMGLSLLATFLTIAKKDGKLRCCLRFSLSYCASFLLLLSSFAIVCVFYETTHWADFRTLAPILWFTVASHLVCQRYALPALSALFSVLMLAILLVIPPVGFMDSEERFTPPAPNEALVEVAKSIPYNPEANNPFGNTVRLDTFDLSLQTALHAGLGLHYGFFTTDSCQKSEWILTKELNTVLLGYEKVVDLPEIQLYKRQSPYEEMP